MLKFLLGTWVGGFAGILIMCLAQVNKGEDKNGDSVLEGRSEN